MGFLGRKEGPPLTPPLGYDQTRLTGGIGDESSFISDEDLAQFSDKQHRNSEYPDERLTRPMIGMGKSDSTL